MEMHEDPAALAIDFEIRVAQLPGSASSAITSCSSKLYPPVLFI